MTLTPRALVVAPCALNVWINRYLFVARYVEPLNPLPIFAPTFLIRMTSFTYHLLRGTKIWTPSFHHSHIRDQISLQLFDYFYPNNHLNCEESSWLKSTHGRYSVISDCVDSLKFIRCIYIMIHSPWSFDNNIHSSFEKLFLQLVTQVTRRTFHFDFKL